MREVHFYANAGRTAHRGEVVRDDGGPTLKVRVSEASPAQFAGVVFEVPRPEIREIPRRAGSGARTTDHEGGKRAGLFG